MEALEEKIKAFLAVNSGYGYGSGYGNGDGYGSGYGDGCGYGYGSGYGDGAGAGDGDGSGAGYGDGCGYGNGDGYGSGYGSGSGDGYGIISYNGRKVYKVDDTPTLIDCVHRNYAKGSILRNDFTLEPCFIAKVGNCFAHGETLKEAMSDAQAKYNKNIPIEERIAKFKSLYPTLDTEAKGKELYNWHHVLTGSCRFGRDEFCRAHNVSMDTEYTIEYFLQLTKDSYGSDVIKRVIDAYK